MITTRMSVIRVLFIASLVVLLICQWEIAGAEELEKPARANGYKDATNGRTDWIPPWASVTNLDQKQFEELRKSEAYPAAVSTVQWMLWKFGYFDMPPMTGKSDKNTQKALREYQERRGLTGTGDLNAETCNRIFRDAEVLDPLPVMLPPVYHFFADFWNSYFEARGTWVSVDENRKIAFPLQSTKVQCYRELGICIEALARVENDRLLSVDSTLYQIARWDEWEIVTNPHDTHCTRYILRINRTQHTVKMLRSTLRTKEICKGIESEDWYFRLEDGFEVWLKIDNARKETLGRVWSSRYHKLLEDHFSGF